MSHTQSADPTALSYWPKDASIVLGYVEAWIQSPRRASQFQAEAIGRFSDLIGSHNIPAFSEILEHLYGEEINEKQKRSKLKAARNALNRMDSGKDASRQVHELLQFLKEFLKRSSPEE